MDLTKIESALILSLKAFQNNSLFESLKSSNAKLIEASFEQLVNYKGDISIMKSKFKVINNNFNLIIEQFDLIVMDDDQKSSKHLSRLFQLLKPNYCLYIVKLMNAVPNMAFNLRCNGFIVNRDSPDLIIAQRPVYSIGSAVMIDSAKKNTTKQIWSISPDDIDEDQIINDDDLLDEKDKVKPSVDELRVCGTTKQRKACANCQCGLKEELEQEEANKIRESSQNAKSSCGNVNLFDRIL